MSITENQLDNLVYAVRNLMAGYGISLDTDLIEDLNELLEDFISDKCDTEITKRASPGHSFTLSFSLTGTAKQEVTITNPSYDKESVLQGLKSGHLVTTTWAELGGIQTISVTGTGELVAEIISHEIDGEYTDFEID